MLAERVAIPVRSRQGKKAVSVHVQVFKNLLTVVEAAAIRVEYPFIDDRSSVGSTHRHRNGRSVNQFLQNFHLVFRDKLMLHRKFLTSNLHAKHKDA
ncbi:hypothetical protein G4G28_05175 [Massilia sp. Dwa41.01b]|uniref:hypothetical protein n=1 Tax=unclassified Massilia TaxID=2609279 RepID=UPI001601F4AD|nr:MULTISPECIES: hypothetical protein [unclassified Massilia]QNA88026.1 hypothetical protein G4G28_05175 [Massilia sp. Dwa41.01b]QNA98928.1 hypothetical protein G4G31_08895 [Massilia sp. Se16.2.3]